MMQNFDAVTARLVLALARDGSIGRTAERENIAASAISRRLADLEARLGVVLFDRVPTGVTLTSAGTTYAEGCRRVFREISDLGDAMAEFAQGAAGQLRIAASSSALSGRLPELLADYARHRPDVVLDIREMSGPATLLAVTDAQVDLAIVADNYDFGAFEIEVFEADDVWVIAAPDHALADRLDGRNPIRFEETLNFEMVGVHHAGALDRLVSAAARRIGRSLGTRVQVETFPSLVRMVEAGFGIGFLRLSSLHLIAGTALVCAPLAEDWAARKLLVARRRRSQVPGAVAAFLDLMRRRRAKDPPAGSQRSGSCSRTE